ncbi:ATP-binding protein [Jannaschia sp. M317]|uniref:AAA family ATPase n=1 Tax=Jannaschia sp. M317 TaxID=2867011 RepID=UPI0021A48F15|nr:ATP-binding protein [Jannaschia sp. M317]UWQ18150.1 ATP-binding protein [Jannaschia sp. M317]
MSVPTLHLMCGKIAAGKSTLSRRLSATPATVLVCEDVWLSTLFGPEMATVSDYLRVSPRLQTVMGPHVVGLLDAGVSVVLDFPANTVGQRAWMRTMVARMDHPHQLHHLDVSDATCLERLAARRAAGTHPFVVTDADFARITSHFAPPTVEEGFTVVTHRDG